MKIKKTVEDTDRVGKFTPQHFYLLLIYLIIDSILSFVFNKLTKLLSFSLFIVSLNLSIGLSYKKRQSRKIFVEVRFTHILKVRSTEILVNISVLRTFGNVF